MVHTTFVYDLYYYRIIHTGQMYSTVGVSVHAYQGLGKSIHECKVVKTGVVKVVVHKYDR